MSFLSGSAPQIQYNPRGISSSTGFSVNPQGNITDSPALSANIGSLQQTFGQAAGAFGALGRTVAPGFSQFRRAGLADITNTFGANRSNLQDTLAQRRILGSSFANSAFSQNAADEAQAKANFEAQSYLQELNASNQLTQEQFSASAQQFSSFINQSNIEASTGAQIISGINSAMANVATAQAELDAKNAAGAGSFFGSLAGNLFQGSGTSLLSGAGSLFSNVADYAAGGGASTLGPLLAGGLVLP